MGEARGRLEDSEGRLNTFLKANGINFVAPATLMGRGPGAVRDRWAVLEPVLVRGSQPVDAPSRPPIRVGDQMKRTRMGSPPVASAHR